MKSILINDPTTFDSVLSSELTTAPPATRIFTYLYGNTEKGTGESWCGDCRKADPLVKPRLEIVRRGVVLYCPVGDRERYRDPENYYRKHPTIQLTAIPTLIEWGNGEVKIKQKLVEAECYDKQLLDAFFKE